MQLITEFFALSRLEIQQITIWIFKAEMIRSLISQILNSPYVDSYVEVYVDDCLMTNKNHSSVGDQVHVALFFVEICIAKQVLVILTEEVFQCSDIYEVGIIYCISYTVRLEHSYSC